MLDYSEEPCAHCGRKTVVYHQYIGDGCCEGCGDWQEPEEE